MNTFFALTKRNTKMFFRDKGMFFTSLITPIILLVLYATFLANVYRDSFLSSLPEGFSASDAIVNATVGGELFSSLLAVCCITVAFCSNLLMVQDKAKGTYRDFVITPVKKSTLALSYYTSTFISTIIITLTATVASLIYVACTGWFLSFGDIMLILLDVFLLTMFGTALSSVVNMFLSTNGQASAVGTVVSAGYGFICGAYMPIASFGVGLQSVLMFLPGTYGTSLLRNHALNGVFNQMAIEGYPEDAINGIREGLDCDLSFFGTPVSTGAMYGVLIGSIVLLLGLFVLFTVLRKKQK